MSEKLNDVETIKKPKHVILKYKERLSFLRKAQDFSKKDDIARAVEWYKVYLGTLALYYEVDEKLISPKLFDQNRDLPELLLISQVYWDLSKAYDRNPRFKTECQFCLQQFAKFSTGYKFQYINSELLRKFIKKGHAYNPDFFEKAYEQIKVQSKHCYIATYCFDENHVVTNDLRVFKKYILNYRQGEIFVDYYYRLSPPLIALCEKNEVLGITFKFFSRPFLSVFSMIVTKFIIK